MKITVCELLSQKGDIYMTMQTIMLKSHKKCDDRNTFIQPTIWLIIIYYNIISLYDICFDFMMK